MRMLIYPEYLFYLLLKKYRPDVVLDVGSRDGRECLKFREILPDTRLVAFEADPDNCEKMSSNVRLKDNSIEVVNKAVSDSVGTIDFHNVAGSKNVTASSILARADDSDNEDSTIKVPVITLNDMFADQSQNKSLAMWVDVEGAAYQVINGASDILKNTLFMHAEVETDYIWEGQKLKSDIDELLKDKGFIELAVPLNSKKRKQFDVLYMNRKVFHDNIISNIYMVILSIIISAMRKILPKNIKYGRVNLLPKAESLLLKLV